MRESFTNDKLITRIESAGPDEQRELLEKVWQELHFLGGDPEGEWDSCRLCQRFHNMLDAEAYLSAAEMLVPEGWHEWHVGRTWKTGEGQCYALDPVTMHQPVFVFAATPALALLAAILKAGG